MRLFVLTTTACGFVGTRVGMRARGGSRDKRVTLDGHIEGVDVQTILLSPAVYAMGDDTGQQLLARTFFGR